MPRVKVTFYDTVDYTVSRLDTTVGKDESIRHTSQSHMSPCVTQDGGYCVRFDTAGDVAVNRHLIFNALRHATSLSTSVEFL